MTPLRYRPAIEQPRADEQAAIDGITQGMTQQMQTAASRDGHAVRTSHAKSSACVVGELTVPALPVGLTQGLFAQPGTYQASRIALRPAVPLWLLRLSSTTMSPGRIVGMSDWVTQARNRQPLIGHRRHRAQ